MLSERYRLDERLGRGAMGDVWRATDLVLGRTVAVKALLPALITDSGFTQRFFAEARIMASLHHPGIVNVYDYGESAPEGGEAAMYLVMECVDGEPLSARMELKGRLAVAETLSMVSQVASALQAAHDADIVHRDVKPSNLLVTDDGTIRLADFGVARSVESAALTATNAVLGTARYMAPEQALGRTATAAVDIYALGAVAYHCLAGVPPFEGGTPIEVALHHVQDEPPPLPDDIPRPVRELVGRAMAKDPARRFPSAAAFGHAAGAVRQTLGSKPDATVAASGQPIRAAVQIPENSDGTAATAGGRAGDTLSEMLPVVVAARRRRGTTLAAAGAGLVLALLAVFLFADMRDDQPSGTVPSPAVPTVQPSKVDTSRPPSGGRVTLSPGLTPTPTPAGQATAVVPPPTTQEPPPATSAPPVTETTAPAPPPATGPPLGGPPPPTGQPLNGPQPTGEPAPAAPDDQAPPAAPDGEFTPPEPDPLLTEPDSPIDDAATP